MKMMTAMERPDSIETTYASKNLSAILTIFKSRWPIDKWKQYGFFDDEYLVKMNYFWLQFPPPSPSSHYLLAVLYTVIMIIGVAGNFLVIIMFLRRRSLRTPSNVLVMNLAISDLFLLLKMPLFIFNSIELGPALGKFGCSIYGFVGGLTGTVSIMTLSAIALDRCQVIVHPLVRKTKQRIYIQVLLIWLYGGFFAILPLLDVGLNRYVPEGYLTSCSFDYLTKDLPSRIMILVFFAAAWVVPVCIITVSYAIICKVVLKTRRGQVNADLARHCKEMEVRNTELRVAVVAICVVGLWFMSWTPYAVVALLGVTGNERYLTPSSSMVPALFCKVASCIDPFLYAVTHPRFRVELNKLFRSSIRKVQTTRLIRQQTSMTRDESTVAERRESDDLEEMVVMITSTAQNSQELANLGQKSFSGAHKTYPFYSSGPPSWFASPFYTNSQTRKTTSLRSKNKGVTKELNSV